MAVALPLRREGFSRWERFWYGHLSGMIEPIVGVMGARAAVISKPILPYAMGFAAGAMIFVMVEELIPESQRGGHGEWATMGVIVGFAPMRVLDVGIQ
jgi:ZIP family zinc transporter